jgi:hypothetical protein
MIRVEAEPLPEQLPGHARFVVTGAPMPPGRVVFQLRREGYATGFLGRGGWQASEEMLAPLDVVAVEEGEGWAIVVGPEVSAHVTEAPYLLRLPSLGQEFGIFWPAIEEYVPGTIYVPRGRAAEAAPPDPARVRFGEPPPPPAPAPTIARQDPPSTATPPPKPVEPEPPRVTVEPGGGATEEGAPPLWKRPLPWVALAVLVLLAGGWALFGDRLSGGGEQQQARQETPPPAPAPTPTPSAQAWPAGTDGMTPREVVQAAPDPAGIFTVAEARQRAGRHDDAAALLEEAARREHGAAAYAFARLVDPVDFVAGRPFQEPNGYEAARHYRDAARRGVAEAEARRAALRSFLEQRAAAGDVDARNALSEFWP